MICGYWLICFASERNIMIVLLSSGRYKLLLLLFQLPEVKVNQNTTSARHRSRRACSVRSSSLVLFRAQASEAVSHMKAQLICALNYLLALLGTDVMSNLHRVLLVVHQQHLQVTRALHQEFVEAVP